MHVYRTVLQFMALSILLNLWDLLILVSKSKRISNGKPIIVLLLLSSFLSN